VTSENVLLGKLDLGSPKFIPLEFHAKLSRSQLARGDLLVNLVGASIGRSCIFDGWEGPANVNQAVGVVTIDPSVIEVKFLASLLASSAGQKLLTRCSYFSHDNVWRWKSIAICFRPIAEGPSSPSNSRVSSSWSSTTKAFF